MKTKKTITTITSEQRAAAVEGMDWCPIRLDLLRLMTSGHLDLDAITAILQAILDYMLTGSETELPMNDQLVAQLMQMQMREEYTTIDGRIISHAQQIAKGEAGAAAKAAKKAAQTQAQPQVAPVAPPTPEDDGEYHGPDDELPYA